MGGRSRRQAFRRGWILESICHCQGIGRSRAGRGSKGEVEHPPHRLRRNQRRAAASNFLGINKHAGGGKNIIVLLVKRCHATCRYIERTSSSMLDGCWLTARRSKGNAMCKESQTYNHGSGQWGSFRMKEFVVVITHKMDKQMQH